ncbi:MAG: hypothetical protein IJN42_07905 [Clostridia bacterium]|nr:hypothetical protein [Clostridia bacterium]
MTILDDIFRTTQKAGKVIAETATDVYDFTKVSYNLATLENKLKEVLVKIGRYTVNEHRHGGGDAEHLELLLSQVEELEIQIDKAKEEKAEIKNEVICHSCGHNNSKKNAFCAACGAKLGE